MRLPYPCCRKITGSRPMIRLLFILGLMTALLSATLAHARDDLDMTTNLWAVTLHSDFAVPNGAYAISLVHAESGLRLMLKSGQGIVESVGWRRETERIHVFLIQGGRGRDFLFHWRTGQQDVPPLALASLFSGSISHDGKWVAWTTEHRDPATLYVSLVDRFTIHNVSLAPTITSLAPYTTWSPDDAWNFVVDTIPQPVVYRVRPDGSDLQQLFTLDNQYLYLSDIRTHRGWLYMTIRNNRDAFIFYRSHLDGTNQQSIEFIGSPIDFWVLPDDSTIIQMQSKTGFYQYRLIDNAFKTDSPIVSFDGRVDYHPQWSPNHHYLAQRIGRVGETLQLLIMREDGSDATLLSYEPCHVDSLSPYWLGDSVYYQNLHDGACRLLRHRFGDDSPSVVYDLPPDGISLELVQTPEPEWLTLRTATDTYLVGADGRRTLPFRLRDDEIPVGWQHLSLDGDYGQAAALGGTLILTGAVWTLRRITKSRPATTQRQR